MSANPVSMAISAAIILTAVILILGISIGGSYLLTLHAINEQHQAICTNLSHLSALFVKANADSTHAVAVTKSSSYKIAQAMVGYYHATCK